MAALDSMVRSSGADAWRWYNSLIKAAMARAVIAGFGRYREPKSRSCSVARARMRSRVVLGDERRRVRGYVG